MNIFFLLPIICGTDLSYTIDKTYGNVVAAVEQRANEHRTTPFKVPNLPVIIEGKDISVSFYARPSIRYYQVDVNLEKNIGKLVKFDKKLQVWGRSNDYLIKSTVNIEWGKESCVPLINRVKQRIINNVECKVLQLEKQRFMYHVSKMGKAETQQEESWYYILWLIVKKVSPL